MYINAPMIDIFPISKARDTFPTARSLSEVNLVKWHRNICDKDSFVISKTFNEKESFEFMIHGYYVKLLGSETGTPFSGMPDGPIYAHIMLDLTDENYPVIYGFDTLQQDGKTVYTGVHFTSTPDFSECEIPDPLLTVDEYSLHILNKSGTTYQVPLESLVKFSSTSLEGVIDGGEDNFEEA